MSDKIETTEKKTASPALSETLRRVLRLLRPFRVRIVLSFLLAALSTLLSLAIPKLTGHAIDCIAEETGVNFPGLNRVLLTVILFAFATALTQWLMTHLNQKICFCVTKDLRKAAFRKIERLPLSYLDSHPTGETLSRTVSDAELVCDGLLLGFSQLFCGVVTILGTVGFMLSIHPWITLVVVVLSPASFLLARFISRKSYGYFGEQSKDRGDLTGYTEEMLDGIKTVKAFGAEKDVCAAFDTYNRKLEGSSMNATFYSSTVNPATRLMYSIIYAGVAIAGSMTALASPASLTVGMLSGFLIYTNQYTKPFNEITAVITEFGNALAGASRVFELLDEKDQPSDASLPALGTVSGDIAMENVSFGYAEKQPLFRGLSLHASSGERIAIVGPTGCGKTTLIHLLMRFYEPTDGRITVDGTDTRTVTRRSLRQNIGMVLQETWLASGTVHENIAFGHPDATREEVENAARAAYAHSFIMRMPNGYDTVIEEGGGNLSGGQKQLLCIARVMLSLPPVLILDEATSSIDTMTEQRIRRAFDEMMRGRTSFIVAHRLSTIKEADRILVMKNGAVIEQGTHDELLTSGGFYRELYESQFAPPEEETW